MVASASTPVYGLPLPNGAGDLADFVDLDSLATKVEAALIAAVAVGGQAVYNSQVIPFSATTNGAAYAPLVGVSILMPNDNNFYRVHFTASSYQTTLVGQISYPSTSVALVKIALAVPGAPPTVLRHMDDTPASAGTPYGPVSVQIQRVQATGQIIQAHVFGPATATITVNAAADSIMELVAYRTV